MIVYTQGSKIFCIRQSLNGLTIQIIYNGTQGDIIEFLTSAVIRAGIYLIIAVINGNIFINIGISDLITAENWRVRCLARNDKTYNFIVRVIKNGLEILKLNSDLSVVRLLFTSNGLEIFYEHPFISQFIDDGCNEKIVLPVYPIHKSILEDRFKVKDANGNRFAIYIGNRNEYSYELIEVCSKVKADCWDSNVIQTVSGKLNIRYFGNILTFDNVRKYQNYEVEGDPLLIKRIIYLSGQRDLFFLTIYAGTNEYIPKKIFDNVHNFYLEEESSNIYLVRHGQLLRLIFNRIRDEIIIELINVENAHLIKFSSTTNYDVHL